MSDTKRVRKEDILKAIPAGFKTIDDLAKILADGDAAKRKEDLKNWYIAGEGLHSLPLDQQEVMFAKSKDYQKYMGEVAEIDKALPQNTEALRDFLQLYFERLVERERSGFEEKMKIACAEAQKSTDFMKQNKDLLTTAQARTDEAIEKGKKYDTELIRVNNKDIELKKREEDLGISELNLERKANEFGDMRNNLKAREAAIVKQEHEYGQAAKEISDALTYARMLKGVVGPKIEGFQTMLDEMANYFQNALKKLPNTQVPPSKPDDLIMPPGEGGETMLGLDVPYKPRPPQPPKTPPAQK